jgi:hypothetical protein
MASNRELVAVAGGVNSNPLAATVVVMNGEQNGTGARRQ